VSKPSFQPQSVKIKDTDTDKKENMGCDIMKARLGGKGSGLIDKRILLLGLDNAGKTSILLQMKENQFLP